MSELVDPNLRLLEELRLCELEVWDALVRGDMEADRTALADSFLGVYSDGFACKHEHAQQLENGPTIVSYAISEERVIPLGTHHGVFSYRAKFLRCGSDEAEVMYVSSIWQRIELSWINIFSQDTPAIGQ